MYLPHVNSRHVAIRFRRHTSTRQAHQFGHRSSVLDAGRGWIRSTGPARHGSGRSSQPLRSYRVRPSIAHRTYMRCSIAHIDHLRRRRERAVSLHPSFVR
eukprot:5235429-Prymnesium_polylepis.1